MIARLAGLLALAALLPAHAQVALPSGFAVRLVKSPDTRDADKPATLGYQRNDGGKHDYITQGAVKFDQDFGENNVSTFSPSLAWNHNTLAAQATDTWSATLAVKRRFVVSADLDTLVLGASVAGQHDQSKSSTSTVTKLTANWYGWPEWQRKGTPDFAALRPTLTLFTKHVSSAAADKTTGITPTGNFTGAMVALDAQAQLGRWNFVASTQVLRPSQVVRGDTKSTHKLHVASITYQFVDPPTTGDEAKKSRFIPGLSLIRQIGEDPLNAVAHAGFTQLVFSLRY